MSRHFDAPTASPPQAAADPLIGTQVGRYDIVSCIGVGGMSRVYRARHASLGRLVALKLLDPEFARDPSLVARFLREARATAAIDHENVIDISDVEELPDGTAYFTMELLEGYDLKQLLRREGRLAWPRAREILAQVARALTAAHAAGIVHRDMKPGNVFLLRSHGRDEFVKLLDFGIAKIARASSLTRAGTIMGTVGYMSPEQAMGAAVDGRTDVYSVACMMFEMLTGQRPFPGDAHLEVLRRHVQDAPPRPRELVPEAGIPAEVEAIVLRGLAKQAEHRYPDMASFERALWGAPGPAGSSPELAADPVSAAARGLGVVPRRHEGSDAATGVFEGSATATSLTRSGLDGTAVTQPEAPRDDPRLTACAFVYLALGHATDGRLDPEEMRVVGAQLRQWVPGASTVETGRVLRETVERFKALGSRAARLDHARSCAEQLSRSCDPDTLRRILADLWRIAGADGQIAAEEQRFIMDVVACFGTVPSR